MYMSTFIGIVCCQGKGTLFAMKYDIVTPHVLFMYLCVSEPVCAELRMCS